MTESGTDLLIVDLDGTLVMDNSFHVFLWAIWTLGGTGSRVKLMGMGARRLASRDPQKRLTMKRHALAVFHSLEAMSRERVVAATLSKINQTISEPVASLVREFQRETRPVLLATAAPDCYARPFAASLKMTDCIATPSQPSARWTEMAQGAKAAACADWIRSYALNTGRTPSVTVVSDHMDDVQLLSSADRAIIQSPPSVFRKIAAALPASTRVEHFDTTSAEEGGGYWLWLDDRPWGPYDIWEIKTILSKHRYALIYCTQGRWLRARPGDLPAGAVGRIYSPTPPPARTRALISVRRELVRNRLGIFH